MNTRISSGLKTVFLVHFIFGLVFGLLDLLMPKEFFGLLNWQIKDPMPFRLVGAAVLGFAGGSWFCYKASTWEQVKNVVLMELIWPPLGALVTLWALLTNDFPAAGWLNFAILAGFAIAFYIYYNQQEAAAAVKAPAPKLAGYKAVAKKAARRGRARA